MWLVEPAHLEGEQPAALFALDVEFDRAAAYFAVFHVGGLIGGQVDARFEPLAAIRAQRRDELLGRQTRSARRRLPHRLQAIELIDAVAVQTGDALAQAGKSGSLRSFHRCAGRWRTAMLRPLRGAARIPQYVDRPGSRVAAERERRCRAVRRLCR